MAREKPAFRLQLESIQEAFPGKEMLGVYEVAKWLKMDSRTVKKRFNFRDKKISIVQLASDMLA